MATTTTSKAFITKDAIITICQGALGSMTFGAYTQFSNNKMMELNNENQNVKHTNELNFIKHDNETKMNSIKQDNETKMNALNTKHTNDMNILKKDNAELKLIMDKIIENQNKRWF